MSPNDKGLQPCNECKTLRCGCKNCQHNIDMIPKYVNLQDDYVLCPRCGKKWYGPSLEQYSTDYEFNYYRYLEELRKIDTTVD